MLGATSFAWLVYIYSDLVGATSHADPATFGDGQEVMLPATIREAKSAPDPRSAPLAHLVDPQRAISGDEPLNQPPSAAGDMIAGTLPLRRLRYHSDATPDSQHQSRFTH